MLQREWLALTRETMPAMAVQRGWPVRHDHCFQRILLDAAFEGRWYDHVAGRPAYIHAEPGALLRAVTLGRSVVAGKVSITTLNQQSLAWRKAVRRSQ